MDHIEIFKIIQSILEDVPLILVGSGSSAPYGLPGMQELGQHLLSTLGTKYNHDPNWCQFYENISNGRDLESALTGITLSPNILSEIKVETWHLISEKDILLFHQVAFENREIALSKLLKKFYDAHPQCVNIITTNYDRVIEYACDAVHLPVYCGFNGHYKKRFAGCYPTKSAVNLIKVHGSLDSFKDPHNSTISIPLQKNIPTGLIPEIITPGLAKYEEVLTGTFRQLLTKSDELINNAHSYLCIGYGFNDTQIQDRIITGIRSGKPIILLTKKVSDYAAHLLANNSKNFVTIECGDSPNTTLVCINRDYTTINNTYWTVEGLLNIID